MPEKVSIKTITLSYMLALLFLGVLAVSSRVITETAITQQKTNAARINIAGRQRMLTNEIRVLSLLLVSNRDPGKRDRVRQQLLESANLMEASHEALLKGDPDLGITGNPSPQLSAMYFEAPMRLDAKVRAFLATVRALAAEPEDKLLPDNPYLIGILASSGSDRTTLLEDLDTATRQYQRESETDLLDLERLEAFILLFNLVSLALMGLFLFRPLVRRIQQETRRIEKYAAELARSNQDLAQFAYVASHDLQEPLRMVSSYVQLLKKRYGDRLDADAAEFINYAVDGSARMQALVNDLLAYSRVGTSGKPFRPTDMGKVVDRAVNNLEVAIEESGADVTWDNLPVVSADAPQMEQLFQNLIGNAIKYRGPESPRVHIFGRRMENAWEFRVSDNGIGIDPQFVERVFIIFQRLHTKDRYSGTGIGLAICRKIVEHHGGRIWVEPHAGPGTTICFTIPAERG